MRAAIAGAWGKNNARLAEKGWKAPSILASMIDLTQSLGVELWQLGLVFASAVLIGFSKTGIGGSLMIAIPFMATAFGGRVSTGIILPMLIFADFMAVKQYHRYADWPGIRRLLPWTVTGLLLGVLVGNLINDRQFTLLIASSILVCLVILVVLELKSSKFSVPDQTWFFALIGLVAGFTTMIGNVAGPIFAVYLLARRYEKQTFLGTTAWFFMIINLIKLPLQIFFWGNVTLQTAVISVVMIPAIFIGAVLGVAVIKRIPEKPFRWVVIGMTAVSIVRLFF